MSYESRRAQILYKFGGSGRVNFYVSRVGSQKVTRVDSRLSWKIYSLEDAEIFDMGLFKSSLNIRRRRLVFMPFCGLSFNRNTLILSLIIYKVLCFPYSGS